MKNKKFASMEAYYNHGSLAYLKENFEDKEELADIYKDEIKEDCDKDLDEGMKTDLDEAGEKDLEAKKDLEEAKKDEDETEVVMSAEELVEKLNGILAKFEEDPESGKADLVELIGTLTPPEEEEEEVKEE